MQLEKEVSVHIEAFEDNLALNIDWDAFETILRACKNVDHWWIVFQDKAFKPYMGDKPDISFAKSDNILEFEEGALSIKRVVYRFGTYPLLLHFFFLPFLARFHRFLI
jgi:hypothetical protein